MLISDLIFLNKQQALISGSKWTTGLSFTVNVNWDVNAITMLSILEGEKIIWISEKEMWEYYQACHELISGFI